MALLTGEKHSTANIHSHQDFKYYSILRTWLKYLKILEVMTLCNDVVG